MDRGKISVIVPIYNNEKYIERCLSSILNQTYRNLEIILVNDGSTDSSCEICESFREKDSRIKLINIENAGVSNARNVGLDNCTGEYVAFVDSDDFLHPQMYEIMMKANNDKYQMVVCNFKEGDDEEINCDKLIKVKSKILNFKKILKDSYYKERKVYISVWNKIIKRSLIGDHRFNIKMRYGEDHIFMNYLYYYSKEVLIIDEPLYYYYRGNENSVCNVLNLESRMDQIYSYIYEYNYFKEVDFNVAKMILIRIMNTIMYRRHY